jgi:hypothetical protein
MKNNLILDFFKNLILILNMYENIKNIQYQVGFKNPMSINWYFHKPILAQHICFIHQV